MSMDPVAPGRREPRFNIWIALGAILLLSSAVRVRMLDVPLDRDEGEYAYVAQLILGKISDANRGLLAVGLEPFVLPGMCPETLSRIQLSGLSPGVPGV